VTVRLPRLRLFGTTDSALSVALSVSVIDRTFVPGDTASVTVRMVPARNVVIVEQVPAARLTEEGAVSGPATLADPTA